MDKLVGLPEMQQVVAGMAGSTFTLLRPYVNRPSCEQTIDFEGGARPGR
jgi:hypothetical protein